MTSTSEGNSNIKDSGRDLYIFLKEADLEHYYTLLTHTLKVTGVAHLKFVDDTDLASIGMAKPEMRRLRKRFLRECHPSVVGRLCRRLAAVRSGRQLLPEKVTPSVDREDIEASISSSGCIVSSEQVQIGRLLGEGDFARVHQAVWRPAGDRGRGLQVAAKAFARERLVSDVDAFVRACTGLCDIDHRSVVRLFGLCVPSDGCVVLLTELAPLRSLLECVREPALRASFHAAVLCDLAQQVAEGMSYLENRRLVHRDLAARNVLVFSRHRVKIGDAGISQALQLGREHYQANMSPSLKLPAAWCAPECVKRLEFTSASDVWSYGVLLWEAFSYGFQPWAGLTCQQILAAVDEPQGSRLCRPDACPSDHYALMLRCWSHDPARRPTFAEVAGHLPKIIPERLTALLDSGAHQESSNKGGSNFLHFSAGETIMVLDKALYGNGRSSSNDGGGGDALWRGVRLDGGSSGLFRPQQTRPQQMSPPPAVAVDIGGDSSLLRPRSRQFNRRMISAPSDMRHTCHIGIDGSVFGDVNFLEQINCSNLPVPGAKAPFPPGTDKTGSLPNREGGGDLQFDLCGSLVDEMLKSWSTVGGEIFADGSSGNDVGDGYDRGVVVVGNGGAHSNRCSADGPESPTNSCRHECDSGANADEQGYDDIGDRPGTRRRQDSTAAESAISSISSLSESTVAERPPPAADRRRCSSVLSIPSTTGRLRASSPPPPPLPPPKAKQQQQQQQQQEQQQQRPSQRFYRSQHAALRSLRSTEAFRAPPGGLPPPKPVRPIVRPEDAADSPWGSVSTLNLESVSQSGGSSCPSPRPAKTGSRLETMPKLYDSREDQMPTHQEMGEEYEEIVNL